MAERGPSPGVTSLLPLGAGRGLADTVHDTLLDAITRGAIAPGSRLPEVVIARQLGISPTPVREAIRSLEREGLVEVHRNRGASVVTTTAAELADLYDLHETLEGDALARAAQRAGTGGASAEQALAAAARLLDEIDAILSDADQVAFNRLDLAFHGELNALSGNPILVTTIERFHRRIQAARIHYDVCLPGRPERSQAQHRQVLDAVRRGDARAASDLGRQHIRNVRDPVLQLLRHQTAPGAP